MLTEIFILVQNEHKLQKLFLQTAFLSRFLQLLGFERKAIRFNYNV